MTGGKVQKHTPEQQRTVIRAEEHLYQHVIIKFKKERERDKK